MESSVLQTNIFHLLSLQKKIRHLQFILVRNLTFHSELIPSFLFFSLHSDSISDAFFESECISFSKNPYWKNLQFNKIKNSEHLCSKHLVIRIWVLYESQCNKSTKNVSVSEHENKEVLLKWVVDLSALQLINNNVYRKNDDFPKNRIIFGINECIYSSNCPNTCNDRLLPHLVLDKSQSLQSYSFNSLNRLTTIKKAIKQLCQRVSRTNVLIKEKLLQQNDFFQKKAEIERTKININILNENISRHKHCFKKMQDDYISRKKCNHKLALRLENKLIEINNLWDSFHELKKSYFDSREDLIHYGSRLVLRRKQLLSDLAFIYPIEKELINDKPLYKICNVSLPSSESIDGVEEIKLSVALGSCCHLVTLMSQFLGVPLRYAMQHRGSRSTIKDEIIDKLPDNEREFPLYLKGKERYQLDYGLYILNKNIAQLRHYCGMSTSNLGLTLSNISSLMWDQLGLPNGKNNAFINQHALAPPSFGGPQCRLLNTKVNNSLFKSDASPLSADENTNKHTTNGDVISKQLFKTDGISACLDVESNAFPCSNDNQRDDAVNSNQVNNTAKLSEDVSFNNDTVDVCLPAHGASSVSLIELSSREFNRTQFDLGESTNSTNHGTIESNICGLHKDSGKNAGEVLKKEDLLDDLAKSHKVGCLEDIEQQEQIGLDLNDTSRSKEDEIVFRKTSTNNLSAVLNQNKPNFPNGLYNESDNQEFNDKTLFSNCNSILSLQGDKQPNFSDTSLVEVSHGQNESRENVVRKNSQDNCSSTDAGTPNVPQEAETEGSEPTIVNKLRMLMLERVSSTPDNCLSSASDEEIDLARSGFIPP